VLKNNYGKETNQPTVKCNKNPQLQNAKCNKDVCSFSPTPINKQNSHITGNHEAPRTPILQRKHTNYGIQRKQAGRRTKTIIEKDKPVNS